MNKKDENYNEIAEKWAKCIMQKNNIDVNNEYKKIEIMNCMMLCFKEMVGI